MARWYNPPSGDKSWEDMDDRERAEQEREDAELERAERDREW